MAKPIPVPTPPTEAELARFWKYVRKEENGCWIWTASCFTSGYGAFALRGRPRRAHRVLYVWTHGEHDQEVLDHRCDNRACVNPDHLIPKSSKENILRGNGPTAQNARRDTCEKGHPLDYVHPKTGWRGCKTCRRERTLQSHDRNRNAINARRRANREHVSYDPRPCEVCGEPFTPQRSTARYCKRLECVNVRQSLNRGRRMRRECPSHRM